MKLKEYRNSDGTYTSPKNGKVYKNAKAFTSHWHYNSQGGWANVNAQRKECQYCERSCTLGNIKQHERACYLNPKNTILCIECQEPIKNYTTSKGTCSHVCSNTHFRHLRNKPENYTRYQTICFYHHGKKCLVCGEDKIVAAHHVNEDHSDDRPENLVPLCPTHHSYMHSRYKDEIQPIIDEYINSY